MKTQELPKIKFIDEIDLEKLSKLKYIQYNSQEAVRETNMPSNNINIKLNIIQEKLQDNIIDWMKVYIPEVYNQFDRETTIPKNLRFTVNTVTQRMTDTAITVLLASIDAAGLDM